MTTLKSLLAEQSFYKGLNENHLELLAECATNVTFEAGQSIIEEGQPADKFYLISYGKVAVQVFTEGRGSLTLETLQEGEVLGWSWLVAPYRWRFDAKAMTLTRAIAFDAKRLREKLDQNHGLGYELLKRFVPVIAGRLEATRFQLLDVYGQHT